MIRVSVTPKKTRAEIMSELVCLDDLKQFKQTVCEPNVSLCGNLLEEFQIDGQMYRAIGTPTSGRQGLTRPSPPKSLSQKDRKQKTRCSATGF